jgi:hypothetical protein
MLKIKSAESLAKIYVTEGYVVELAYHPPGRIACTEL